MRVVDDHEQRALLARACHQAQDRCTGGEAVPRCPRRRCEGERSADRVSLGLGQLAESFQEGRDDLAEQGVGEVRLGLDAGCLDHAQVASAGLGLGQHRGLADPRLAEQQQRATAPLAGLGQEAFDPLELETTSEQHGLRLRAQAPPATRARTRRLPGAFPGR
ncbi:MAG: hypothetical protein WB771_09440, partial [Solirubrobacterales bacterium]